MKYYYDLHVHTVLSPCGDYEMTPNNIVNMAHLKGLNFVAISDHNSVQNVRACIEALEHLGYDDLLIVPAMELETSEEVHVLCLFDSIDKAEQFGQYVADNIMYIKNNTNIYGTQTLVDCYDNSIGEVENLLVTSTHISTSDVSRLVKECGGVAIPSHIDKPSNSIISNLGFIHEDMDFSAVEVSTRASNVYINQLRSQGFIVLVDSDSHYIEDLNEQKDSNIIELQEFSLHALINSLRGF